MRAGSLVARTSIWFGIAAPLVAWIYSMFSQRTRDLHKAILAGNYDKVIQCLDVGPKRERKKVLDQVEGGGATPLTVRPGQMKKAGQAVMAANAMGREGRQSTSAVWGEAISKAMDGNPDETRVKALQTLMASADHASRPRGRGPVIQRTDGGRVEKGRAKASAWASQVHLQLKLAKTWHYVCIFRELRLQAKGTLVG